MLGFIGKIDYSIPKRVSQREENQENIRNKQVVQGDNASDRKRQRMTEGGKGGSTSENFHMRKRMGQ